MLSASLALLLQLSVGGAPVTVTDEALAAFARQESPLGFWLAEAITHDPALGVEMKRVGFAAACNILVESRNSVTMRYRERLVPVTVKSVRDQVPADRLEEMKILSFLVGPMQMYKARVLDQVRSDGAAVISDAEAEMRSTFLSRTAVIDSIKGDDANIVIPKPDIAKALQIVGAYDLDNPNHIMLACTEQHIAPDQRPTITTGP
jgi:hypothetical protein